jgi:capsular exopolysaccharide synthesis family protein
MRELSIFDYRQPSEMGPVRGPTLGWAVREPPAADVVHYLRILRRRHKVFRTILLGVLLIAGLITALQTPAYRAESLLLVERQARLPQAIDVKDLQADTGAPPVEARDFYQTQLEILTSQSLARQVIEEQQLASLDFVPDGLLYRLLGVSPHTPTDARGGDQAQSLVNNYRLLMDVRPVVGSGMVRLGFTTTDPELSARIVNAHAHAFIRHGIERYARATEDARAFLAATLQDLKEKMETSEQALSAYRQREQILAGESPSDPIFKRLETLSERWAVAEANRIDLENQLSLIRKGQHELVPAIDSSPTIAQLRAQLREQEARDAMLAGELRTHTEEARKRLEAEMRRVVASLESTYQVAQATEADLRQRLQEQKSALLREQDLSAHYVVLEREAQANRALYESVFQRLRSMELATKVQPANVFVIDPARPPGAPSAPRPLLNLAVGLAAALVLSVGGALLAEVLSTRFRDAEEVQHYLGLANLGTVPDMRSLAERARQSRPRAVPRDAAALPARPASALQAATLSTLALDAYRTIRANLVLSQAGEPPRVVLFSSAGASEGKTATAVNTAVMFAQTGARVLVIDADLRSPSCHGVLDVEQVPGLTEVLTGAIDVQRALQPTKHLVTLLTAGSLPPNPAELLGSETMRALLATLRGSYDHILIDAAPVLGLPDTLPLATFVDGVVLVIDHNRSTRSHVRQAVSRLSFAQGKFLGVVLNRVDVRELDAGSYPYYPYGLSKPA